LYKTAMFELLSRLRHGLTVHGFRSTFSTWVSEETDFPKDVREAALAHGDEDKVAAAYQRGEFLAKRTALMAAWERYLLTPASDKVVALRRA
jgi:integrase